MQAYPPTHMHTHTCMHTSMHAYIDSYAFMHAGMNAYTDMWAHDISRAKTKIHMRIAHSDAGQQANTDKA